MTPSEVKDFYKSFYRFNKQTNMSKSTLLNWCKWGFVPYAAQRKIEILTKGKLEARWEDGKVN